jgi:hypothetical protein
MIRSNFKWLPSFSFVENLPVTASFAVVAVLLSTLILRVYEKEDKKTKYATCSTASFVSPVYQKNVHQYS